MIKTMISYYTVTVGLYARKEATYKSITSMYPPIDP